MVLLSGFGAMAQAFTSGVRVRRLSENHRCQSEQPDGLQQEISRDAQNERGNVNILSSMAAFRSIKGNPASNASKTGAYALTRTLRDAWAEDRIRVNGIAPGFVDTKLMKVTRPALIVTLFRIDRNRRAVLT
mgnify:FL=1